jgi:transposase
MRIGSATVERWFHDFLLREVAERKGAVCPRILGIEEHFFSRKAGYATTFCDLRSHTIFDVVLGRSEAALEDYLAKLPGKGRVRVVCMDLSSVYRPIIRKHFPKAKIVADRFHVIRLVNHHFLACWREIDPIGGKHRGLLSLMRRHRHNLKPEQRAKLERYFDQFPALGEIYRFKQRLCYLLLKKHRTRKQCEHLAPSIRPRHRGSEELRADAARPAGSHPFVVGDEDRHDVALHQKQRHHRRLPHQNGKLQRQTFGFRNFNNYRLRVRIMCS